MADKEVAFVLPEDAASVAEPVVFPEVPGVWTAGEAKPASMLGLTVQEMRDLIKENDLPLKETKAEAASEDALAFHGGIVSGATARSERLGVPLGPDDTARAAADHAKLPLPAATEDEEA